MKIFWRNFSSLVFTSLDSLLDWDPCGHFWDPGSRSRSVWKLMRIRNTGLCKDYHKLLPTFPQNFCGIFPTKRISVTPWIVHALHEKVFIISNFWTNKLSSFILWIVLSVGWRNFFLWFPWKVNQSFLMAHVVEIRWNQCFGSIFIESGSGSSKKSQSGSGSRKALNPDPDPSYFFTLSESFFVKRSQLTDRML